MEEIIVYQKNYLRPIEILRRFILLFDLRPYFESNLWVIVNFMIDLSVIRLKSEANLKNSEIKARNKKSDFFKNWT